jgi:hypothetical protein
LAGLYLLADGSIGFVIATPPPVTPKTKIFEIEIELRDVQPAVRRRIQVPGEASLSVLHAVLQSVMGWTNTHAHEFEIEHARYGVPDPDWDEGVGDEAKVKLFRVISPGGRMSYVYDFGDNWTHTLTVDKVGAPELGVRYPRCVAGLGACPPEDVGGPPGYDAFQEAITDPLHPDHRDWTEWVGGPFDPTHFDLAEVNRALDGLAWRPLSVQLASS